VAVRRSGSITVDGRLEEPEWRRAPVFDAFVQVFPFEGAPPAERTEVRVLYDDRALYVGIRCLDARPDQVSRPLGRRDAAPYGDAVTVLIDSVRDGRSAYAFSLSAAGVQSDGLLGDDDQTTLDWDGIWEGEVAATGDGWSAELAIPLAVLRFPDRPSLTFGFAVKRTLARLHEDSATVLFPRSARGQVARLAPLVGLEGIHPVPDLEVMPYLAARAVLRPQWIDPTLPYPRLLDPIGEVGVDLRAALGPGLTLQGTVNPDFGQVEADQVIQNLSTFEVLFPEKRGFFTQGMDLFQPVTATNRPSPQQMFYSRRIGLDAPILAAAKLTGTVTDSVQLGVLDAFVDGAGSELPDGAPGRSFRFDPAQPLRFGPRSSLPLLTPAARNFLVGVTKWRPDPRVALGATASSVTLAGPACTAAEAALDDSVRPPRCDALAGTAAAVDWSLRSRDGDWFFRGQAAGSRSAGGPPERILPDGTAIRRGDLGVGAYASAGRQGGEPWRFELQWELESPKLDLNAAGFQRTQNEQQLRAVVRYVRPNGGGPFHAYGIHLAAQDRRTTDGTFLDRGAQVGLSTEFQLRSFHWFGVEAWADLPRWDVREIDQAGVALRLPGDVGGDAWFSTDPSRPVVLEGGGTVGRTLADGPLPATPFWGVFGRVVIRPHARLETRLDTSYDHNRWPVRWADTLGTTYFFAPLTAPALSITLRQQLVLTPRLTLQGYGQLFVSVGSHGPFLQGSAPAGGRLDPGDLVPAPLGDPVSQPDFRSVVLNLNLVLRWEYRLGSTLFLVYARSQQERGYSTDPGSPPPSASLRPDGLAHGPTVDTLLVKWTYWWSR